MHVQFDPTKFHSVGRTDSMPPSSHPTNLRHNCALSSAKNEPSFFTHIWDYIKGAGETIYEWAAWLLGICLCQFNSSRIDILYDAIDEPAATAGELGKHPIRSIGSFILAALEDPEEFSCQCQEHRENFIEFIQLFKKEVENTKSTPFHHSDNVFPAFLKILTLGQHGQVNELYEKLFNFIQEHPKTFRQAAIVGCEKTASFLNNSSNGSNVATSLKTVFFGLKNMISDMDDKAVKIFAADLLCCKNIGAIKNAIEKITISNKLENKEAFLKALNVCFEKDGNAFFQLQDTTKNNLAVNYLGLPSRLDLQQTFAASLLTSINKEQLAQLAKMLKEDFPLGSDFLEQLGKIANNKRRMKNIADNLPKALSLLNPLYQDYLNPIKP